MAERTPRPWHVERSESQHMGMPKITVYHHGVSVASLNMRHLPTAEVNAHLIAAAPEMLELLEWIIDGGWNDGPGSWVVLDRRVEEVIAKAKGET